jgi:hypothetical protein
VLGRKEGRLSRQRVIGSGRFGAEQRAHQAWAHTEGEFTMRRKLVFLAVAAVLAVMLATPASASRSQEIRGTFSAPVGEQIDEQQIGNSCHVTVTNQAIDYSGDIAARCVGSYTVVQRGICAGGPGIAKMVLNLRSYHCEGVVLGKEGEFDMKANGVLRPPEIGTFTTWALISGTGET